MKVNWNSFTNLLISQMKKIPRLFVNKSIEIRLRTVMCICTACAVVCKCLDRTLSAQGSSLGVLTFLWQRRCLHGNAQLARFHMKMLLWSLYDLKQNQRKTFHFFIFFCLWLHIPFYVYSSIIKLSTYGSFGFSIENSIRLLCLTELLIAHSSEGSIFLPFIRKFRQNAMCCCLLSKPCLLDFSEFYSLRDNCTSNHILIKHSNQYNHLLILILSSR